MPKSEEEQKMEALTPEVVSVEFSKPASSSSGSNHPFFSEKIKESAQERIIATKMQGLENQQKLIQSLVQLAKNFLIEVEDKIQNDCDLGNKKAIANCMGFVKGKIQALHKIYNELFTRDNKEFNKLCDDATVLCQQYELEFGAAQIINYIKRQAVTNSLLGTIETIEAAFNLGFMKLTIDKKGNIGNIGDSASCLGQCSVM